MKLPDIRTMVSLRGYCQELVVINRLEVRPISFRHWARKLRWPLSLLPDVIGGRRKLSMERCLQMATALELTQEETENLIRLAIMQNSSPLVTEFFCKQVEGEPY